LSDPNQVIITWPIRRFSLHPAGTG